MITDHEMQRRAAERYRAEQAEAKRQRILPIPVGTRVEIAKPSEPSFHGQAGTVVTHGSHSKCTVSFRRPEEIRPVVPYPDVPPPRTWVFSFGDLRPISDVEVQGQT